MKGENKKEQEEEEEEEVEVDNAVLLSVACVCAGLAL